MISITSRGNFNHLERLLKNIFKSDTRITLEKYGEIGVSALAGATPVDSGVTKNSWGYEIEKVPGGYKIYWTNDHINKGVNIAVILQYGHGTGFGGYVQGRDYINPTIRPIFDGIANDAWNEVTNE